MPNFCIDNEYCTASELLCENVRREVGTGMGTRSTKRYKQNRWQLVENENGGGGGD
jgi:hypothetical protein